MFDWQPIETAPKSGYICVGTQYGKTRWSFNHAWWNEQTEEWVDEFGDQVLNPHVWVPLPPAQTDPRSY